MPGGPPANHVEPATRNSTSTPAPKPSWIASPRSQNAGLNQLQITARPDIPHKGRPEIFVSFAWGDASSEDARKRTEVVDRLCETLDKDGWNILRDATCCAQAS